jgi:hypothetical protein
VKNKSHTLQRWRKKAEAKNICERPEYIYSLFSVQEPCPTARAPSGICSFETDCRKRAVYSIHDFKILPNEYFWTSIYKHLVLLHYISSTNSQNICITTKLILPQLNKMCIIHIMSLLRVEQLLEQIHTRFLSPLNSLCFLAVGVSPYPY